MKELRGTSWMDNQHQLNLRETQNALLDAELSITKIQSNIMIAFYRLQHLQGSLINYNE